MVHIILNNTSIKDGENNDTSSGTILETALSATARFWVLLIFEIPSMICCLFLLYHLCFDRTLRNTLNNHVFILILINVLLSEIIDIPNYLTFLRLNYVWPQIPINCYLWWYATYGNLYTIGMLMAWASIERHILIFHYQWLNTKVKRILIHYIPLTTIALYACIFYATCIFFPVCQPTFNYSSAWCIGPCYIRSYALSLYDLLFNITLPCLVILIVNILLFIRVFKQKQRLHQEIQWQRYKRMIIQLASCSLLFLIPEIPTVGILLAQKGGLPYGATGQFESFVFFSCYFIVLLMPFICFGSSEEIWTKMKLIMRRRHFNNFVAPQALKPFK
ncbi:unnamed protein product [Adineta steineri]|uniref:G-protein coupled receptors family 1 profile domain-containing protein n=1 Tax=Adineta steineri TaxID=433720 RepID=A0A819QMK9_9BILA|nr:unnamed protein product [Adineta steineri]